jgi:hypothetical protein
VLLDVRYWVLTVILYGIPQKVGLDVFYVSVVEAASCRISLLEVDVVLLPLVVVVNEWEVEALVV